MSHEAHLMEHQRAQQPGEGAINKEHAIIGKASNSLLVGDQVQFHNVGSDPF